MKLYKTSKVVLAFKNNPENFLNGLTANTLTSPRNAFVDVHGKIIATFDQVKIADNEFWIAIEEKFLSTLLGHVEKFAKLSKVEIEKKDLKVYFDLNNGFKPQADEKVISQRQGQLILTEKELPSTVPSEEFTLFRLQNNIPVQGMDYGHEFLLNVDDQEYVSFTKGCFLGQELLAKVHNRSRPSKKLIVEWEDDCAENQRQAMTSKVKDPQTGRIKGFIFADNHA